MSPASPSVPIQFPLQDVLPLILVSSTSGMQDRQHFRETHALGFRNHSTRSVWATRSSQFPTADNSIEPQRGTPFSVPGEGPSPKQE